MPYYCVIGGWVCKYLFEYLRGGTMELAQDAYFSTFLGSAGGVEGWFLLFAALTSSISLAETGVSTFQDQLGWSRKKCTALVAAILLGLGTLCALGYNALDFLQVLGMDMLDFFDFLTNSVMMPIGALATCFLITRAVGLNAIAQEMELSSAFRRKRMYGVFMKYFAPVCLLIILVSSLLNVFGVISM